MEVWALYAYGAAHVLQEMMTVKSDDVVGRVKVYESLVKGLPLPTSGVPESFRVLIKEFQALGLDITVLDNEGKFVDVKELEAEEEDMLNSSEIIDASTLPEPDEPEDSVDDEEEFDDLDDILDDELDEKFLKEMENGSDEYEFTDEGVED